MMKRMVAIAAAALLVPCLAEAQDGFSLGFRGGLTSTTISLDPEDETDFSSTTGIILGGFAQFPVGESFGVQTGLNYTQKGADEEGDMITVELSYLEVPVLGVFAVPTSGPLGIRLMGGPVASFELSCELSGEGQSIDCEDAEIDTESFDFGLLVGVGLIYDLQGVASLFFDAGYNVGLANIAADSEEDESAKNRALLFSVGVDFPMGG